jgi:RNA polymerase sigma-70 factor (ECF subfamily)
MNTWQKSSSTLKLVEEARKGDREAYNRLFALTADRALHFIRLRLGPRLRENIDSMDILQDAYLQAHLLFDRFEYRGDDAFARWLSRIIENRIRDKVDYLEAKKRKKRGDMLRVDEVLSKMGATGTGVATRAERLETREKLEVAIQHLDAEEHEALLLRYYQGRTIEEIADLLGRSRTSIRRILGRAALRLGTLLKTPEEDRHDS